MKPWHLMTALSILLATGLAAAAPGADELVMSRSAQVLGDGGSGRYQLEVTVTLEAGSNVAAGLTALAVEETLPTGWVYELDSVVATPAPATVNPIAGNTHQFVWVTLPNLSTAFTFTYLVNYPSGASGDAIIGSAPYRTSGGQLASNVVTTPQNAISCLKMTRTAAGYVPGQDVTVQVTVESFCGEPVTALAVEESWAPGWTYVSSSGVGLQDGDNAPAPNAQGTFQFFWFSPIPAFPYTFSYVVKAPVASTGPVTVSGQTIARLSGPEVRTPLLDTVLDRLDTTPPVISLIGANPLALECGTPYVEPGATAMDNIDGAIVPVITGSVNSAVLGAYAIDYTATDNSGNMASVTRIVNVVDTTPPTITLLGANFVTVECGTPYTDAGATATDTCSASRPVVVSGSVNVAAVGLYTLRYNANDGNGNNAVEVARIVSVVDTTAPVITLLGANPVTIQCGTTYSDAGATAADTCAGDRTGSIAVTNPVNAAAVGVYTVLYNVEDGNGNSAVEVTRTVNVVDTTAPVITRLGANPVTVQCGTTYSDAGATAADTCAGDRTTSITVTNPVNAAAVGTYTVRYNVTDGNGNSAVEVIRTVNVVDTTVPVITRLGANPVTVQCGATYTDAGATATDSCAGDRTTSIVATNPVNAAAVGTYTVRYNVTDGNGNSAVEVTRTVNVVDTTAPVLTLNGSATVTVACRQAYTELGATALDACSGDLSSAVTISGQVDTAAAGTYLITYRVSDARGNAAEPVTRTVTVTDTVAPVITLVGAANVSIACGQPYVELGATALDACAGDLSGAVTITGAVNSAVPGSYVRTYRVSDPSGHAAVPVTRTVQVTDSVVPLLTLNGAATMTVECGAAFSDPGATALDACEGSLAVAVAGAVNSAVLGTYTLTYSAHDSSGNAAVPVTRTVTVADTAAPVIALAGANPLLLDCGRAFADPGASAIDACDGPVTVTSDAGEINTNFPASYEITYTATDSQGHTATARRSVVVGGVNCDYCPMTDIVILQPAAKLLIPAAVAQTAVALSSDVAFASSADCIEGTVQVFYTVNGIKYVPSTDRANHFPISLLLAPGEYSMRAEATLVETGQVVVAEKTFSVVSVQVGTNGYPLAPFTTLTPDGTSFSNRIDANGFNRTIEMVAAQCPEDGGATDDIVITVDYYGDGSQMLSVKVPRAVVPCGSQALVTVTVSDTIEGLVGSAEAPYFTPVPGGLVAGGLLFDVSILVASLSDITDGEPVSYGEIDNAIIAANPVSIALSGLTFAPNLIPIYLSHPSSFAPGGSSDLNLFGDAADWTDDNTKSYLVKGNTLYAKATALSVFAPFEKEKVLSFAPDIEYGVVFGRAVIDTGIYQVFVVTNNGDIRATGTASLIDENDVFTLLGEGVYDLAAGESFEMAVRFRPKEARDYEAVLNFSGVPNTNLSVRVLGTGTVGPRKKFLSFLACAPASQNGQGGDLLVLAAAVGLLALGRSRRAWRRHS